MSELKRVKKLICDLNSKYQNQGHNENLTEVVFHQIQEVFEKAEMLDALLNQQRIRVISTTGLGKEKYQHIGLEMWTRHLGVEEKTIKQETEAGRSVLLNYLRTHASAIRNRSIPPIHTSHVIK